MTNCTKEDLPVLHVQNIKGFNKNVYDFIFSWDNNPIIKVLSEEKKFFTGNRV